MIRRLLRMSCTFRAAWWVATGALATRTTAGNTLWHVIVFVGLQRLAVPRCGAFTSRLAWGTGLPWCGACHWRWAGGGDVWWPTTPLWLLLGAVVVKVEGQSRIPFLFSSSVMLSSFPRRRC